MAASPTAVPSPKTDGGNALAALLAAAAASMHRQQQNQQLQQQTHANIVNNTEVQRRNKNNSGGTKRASAARLIATLSDEQQKRPNQTRTQKIHQQLESNQDTLRQLLNLKPATMIDASLSTNRSPNHLVSWHDEDEGLIDASSYQELVDSNNSNGWSADEMFKYNEKMHKITSSYNEKTLAGKYTTPLPKTTSKATMRLATQLAREIEERVLAEGRITPESSDDDELFETERRRRVKLKQQKQHDCLKIPQRMSLNRCSNNQTHLMNNAATIKTTTNTTKSSSQYSNSTETPATTSLSSSPTLNETIKPVTSSSRNILRTCLT